LINLSSAPISHPLLIIIQITKINTNNKKPINNDFPPTRFSVTLFVPISQRLIISTQSPTSDQQSNTAEKIISTPHSLADSAKTKKTQESATPAC